MENKEVKADVYKRQIIPSYISIDRKTNEITDIPASRVHIPERIGKTEITTQERDMLRAGPVSYTHLDVYKRQELQGFWLKWR